MINLILNEGLRDFMIAESKENIEALDLYADQLIEDNVDPKLEEHIDSVLGKHITSNLFLYEHVLSEGANDKITNISSRLPNKDSDSDTTKSEKEKAANVLGYTLKEPKKEDTTKQVTKKKRKPSLKQSYSKAKNDKLNQYAKDNKEDERTQLIKQGKAEAQKEIDKSEKIKDDAKKEKHKEAVKKRKANIPEVRAKHQVKKAEKKADKLAKMKGPLAGIKRKLGATTLGKAIKKGLAKTSIGKKLKKNVSAGIVKARADSKVYAKKAATTLKTLNAAIKKYGNDPKYEKRIKAIKDQYLKDKVKSKKLKSGTKQRLMLKTRRFLR